MEKRTQELIDLQAYISKVETETSLLLQSLQWDRGHFLQEANMVQCLHNYNHKVPERTKHNHEKECFFRSLGYVKEDPLLPDATESPADNCVKFSLEDVKEIIETAAMNNPQFRRGVSFGSTWTPPLSASRVTSTYTRDERRALYDAVIERAPPHSVPESALISVQDQEGGRKQKSRMELLAEQRDMKRRRTKYRVATNSKNYSQVLQEVIRNQMELYAEVVNDKVNQRREVTQGGTEPADKAGRSRNTSQYRDVQFKDELRQKHRYKQDITSKHDSRHRETTRHRSHTARTSSDNSTQSTHRDRDKRSTYKHYDKHDRRSRHR